MRAGTSEKQRGVEISEEKDDPFVCFGYHRSTPWTWLSYALCVLTVGFSILVFYWKPDWFIRMTCYACDLQEADSVIIKDIYRRNHVCSIRKLQINSESECSAETLRMLFRHDVVVDGIWKYFRYQEMLYVWHPTNKAFYKLRALDGATSCSEFYDKLQNGLSRQEAAERRYVYGLNKIVIQVRPILVLLVQEVLNPFYVFQIFSVCVWMVDEYYIYSGCIILMSFISIALSLYTTRKQSTTLRDMVHSDTVVEVLRKSGESVEVMEEEIVPGDVIILPSQGCLMTCDAVLLTGNCIVNESMLTGESVPVTKTPLPRTSGVDGESAPGYSADKHKRHTLFCGTQVIQTRYYGGEMVKAVVVQTGFSTAKGGLVRSILFPKPMDFSMLKDAIMFIGLLASFAFIGFIYTIVVFVNFGFDAGYIAKRCLDIITIAVPPVLPAALTIGMVYAQLRLKAKGIFCISPQRINTCGTLNVVCFDKTGTLTEDGLDLMGVQLASDGSFGKMKTSVTKDAPVGHLTVAMATCHSLTIINGEISGDPIDLKMFQASGWELEEPTSEETTHFDMMVPTIVRSPATAAKRKSEEVEEVGILKQFPFSSELQRMSVITKSLRDEPMQLYIKGSPELVASLSKMDTVPSDFQEQLNSYTQDGFRVLALATKQLDSKLSWHKLQQLNRDQVERDLTFVGLLIMQNKMKPETKPVIDELMNASIRTVMVTGDNILTAINIARKCGMVGAEEDIVRIEADYCADAKHSALHCTKVTSEQDEISSDYRSFDMDMKNGETSLQIEPFTRRKVHFAIDGKSLEMVRKHHQCVLPQLAVQGTIFARMTPDQKSELVQTLQDLDYRVGMCGDGANDCGALKAAHAGIALSEAEASVASPFTSKIQNISCVPIVIKEGRAALVTSFGMFKFIALYSMIQFVSVMICYTVHSALSNFMFMYSDIFVCTTVILFMGRNKAYHSIAMKKPTTKLFVTPIILSLTLQVAIQTACQAAIFVILKTQSWYVPMVPSKTDKNIQCWETTSVFLVSMFQYTIMAIVYTPGKPYRKAIYRNYLYMVDLFVIIVCSFVMLFYPPTKIEELFEFEHIPSFRFKGIILAVVFGNFILSAFVELFLVSNRSLLKLVSCKNCRRAKRAKYEELMMISTSLGDPD
ncbi:polyamine-transporting ATPase 13A3-like [Asterias amurensis]|uniref:polyamine-transporting ATPase 13A3-like n=1 Tax=Asterias amurensis TaxID=7602 RepID=UPI003AB16FC1